MSLTVGTPLGPYRIEGILGAGGMGEVYRAHDPRLGRSVAIKIIPEAVARDPDALARFEREARAVAMLSHPNILTLYEFVRSDGISYAVTELLDGETLRARLGGGALPARKTVEIAAQIARGLAAAHDKQIVHRDLKPENVFIGLDGSVKILDFGLARLATESTLTAPDAATVAPITDRGVVLGTVGYMAPEQVRGERVDHRADLFALGSIVYEMLTGRRAFQRDTAAESMTAILKEEPPGAAASGVVIAPAIQRLINRCLEKRPEERFQSARDLSFALESALDASHPPDRVERPAAPARRRWVTAVSLLVGGAILGAAIVAMLVSQRRGSPSNVVPSFRQLTFERGTIRDARFAPDGQSVLYSAAWDANPLRVFMTRTDAAESVPLTLPDARLLSVARNAEIAISIGHTYEGWMGAGTLARSSVLGSAPRIIAENVREAEWAPDGSDLAIVRRADTLEQLEFPIGRVLYTTSGFISSIRFSPDGKNIAFADHPVFADDAGFVSVIDREGRRTVLSDRNTSVRGLAWAPQGGEVWFSAGTANENGVYAVTMSGRRRTIWPTPSFVKLLDVSGDGRVLLGDESSQRRVEALFAGAPAPVDVSVRSGSHSHWIAPGGAMLTLSDQSTARYSAYLRKADAPPVRLGDGQAFGVSKDGRWMLSLPVDGGEVLLHPTGAGQSRGLPNPDKLVIDVVAWLPDSRRVVFFGQKPGQVSRGFVQDIDGGPPKPFTTERSGVRAVRWWTLPVSPDGTRVIAAPFDGQASILQLSDGRFTPVPNLGADEVPVQWLDDGDLLVAPANEPPWKLQRLNLKSGRRSAGLEIRPTDRAGLRLSVVGIATDGRHYVHSYSRLLSNLFVVEGLR
jgi:eukaryotic-like serine/threonine-protein kinase